MSITWYIFIALSLLWYGYLIWLFVIKNDDTSKKQLKNIDNLHINSKLVYNSENDPTNVDAVLNQLHEAEDASELLEAFRKGSLEEDSNSLTHRKHEKLTIIRTRKSAGKSPPDSKT
ncbi:hypothetical protein [Arenibacter latericius]|uniref:hypothetical protein n=1 Tax=Arenibacter latericius TaxID=86104 RepID=UPI0012F97521|nr:hypothetical protein [Arenibacter latericius]